MPQNEKLYECVKWLIEQAYEKAIWQETGWETYLQELRGELVKEHQEKNL